MYNLFYSSTSLSNWNTFNHLSHAASVALRRMSYASFYVAATPAATTWVDSGRIKVPTPQSQTSKQKPLPPPFQQTLASRTLGISIVSAACPWLFGY